MNSHYSADQLAAFKLDPASSDQGILQHLVHCPQCRNTLARLDQFLNLQASHQAVVSANETTQPISVSASSLNNLWNRLLTGFQFPVPAWATAFGLAIVVAVVSNTAQQDFQTDLTVASYQQPQGIAVQAVQPGLGFFAPAMPVEYQPTTATTIRYSHSEGLSMQWGAFPGVDRYQIQLSDADGNVILDTQQQPTQLTQAELTLQSQRHYQWQISGLAGQQQFRLSGGFIIQ